MFDLRRRFPDDIRFHPACSNVAAEGRFNPRWSSRHEPNDRHESGRSRAGHPDNYPGAQGFDGNQSTIIAKLDASVVVTMQLQDPFPIDSFPRNVRMAILAEFAGRCPSVREAIGIPDAYWLTVPGVGPRRLAELRRTLNAMPAFPHAPAFDGLTDAELVAERERLHRESRALRGEIASRRRSVRAVSAELIRRGMTDSHRSDARERDDPEGS